VGEVSEQIGSGITQANKNTLLKGHPGVQAGGLYWRDELLCGSRRQSRLDCPFDRMVFPEPGEL
jgi:hypothetical protein